MKKILYAITAMTLLTSCGVGTYSISSGRPSDAYISFTAAKKNIVTVTIDDNSFSVETVKTKPYKPGRKIKNTAVNSIKVSDGPHQVKVKVNGSEVYNKKLVISSSEHRIIDL